MATPTGTKVDAERARLRALGYTDAEIHDIIVKQAVGGGAQQPAGAVPVQGNMTGVLGNASAVLSHARGAIPAIKADFGNLSNSAASANSRQLSGLKLAGVAVIVAVLGYAIYQEWQIHIVNAPITAAGQATKVAADARVAADVAAGQVAQARKAEADAGVASEVARGNAADARMKEAQAQNAEALAAGEKAKACSARLALIAEQTPLDKGTNQDVQNNYDLDCNPQYSKCRDKFQALIVKIKIVPGPLLSPVIKLYGENCLLTLEQAAQLRQIIAGRTRG